MEAPMVDARSVVPFGESSPAPARAASAMAVAFEALFLAEYGRVVAVANRVLLDRAEAEDVAQEVFLEFHRRHSPVASYAAAWLHRAAWHAALNRVRGRRRRERREQLGAIGERDDGWSADPQRIAERNEERAQVRAAMAKLPARAAGVLALRYSGLSYTEVAEVLGIGVGQVGTVLRRAEARLKREVER